MNCEQKTVSLTMVDDNPASLEYIEDPYYPIADTITPSLDDEEITQFDRRSLYDLDDIDVDVCREWSPETEHYLRSLPLEQIFSIADDCDDDYQKVEAELGSTKNNCDTNGISASRQMQLLRRLFNRKSMRDVKVTFIDFSKPYLAKISSSDNYKQFLNINSPGESPKKQCFSLRNIFFSCVGGHVKHVGKHDSLI